ncbi:adenosylmethionine--8-amino-7-oxononanoate transaminase [Psittacicella gerlachiana]|uniref:adenosylmethionine--8-amino-7-oxononanoate transaminase n=1 Tax=Psittacicella gerlachiana TaxID=2028574 RepID=A0A3A1YP47_9GAMM|nr:adenosylmethionine--8-amino-7-oxononanoate transaminase [Psittacicella gerlachiana]RIY37817.1 adenosylmethionine--8-amino-7-oxononanoate transaminase [Psittacicella gerlachiana]
MSLNYDLHNIHAYDAPYSKNNLFIESAKGVYLYDAQGTAYLDAISSWWSTSFGHANPTIVEAIIEQSKTLPHVMFAGITHKPALELTKALLELLNYDFDQFFYADSGSVAVEVALKLSLQYQLAKGQSKSKFIALRNGYHGDTWNAMQVSEPDGYLHNTFKQKEINTLFTPPPPKLDFTHLNVDGTFSSLSMQEFLNSDFGKTFVNLLETNKNEIAAFICEPMVQGAGGFNFYDLRYIDKAIEICKGHGILIIFDEIATGFGRTSLDFAYQTITNKPDILTLGKALTGGHIGLGVTAFSKEIAQTIKDNPPYAFLHGPTFMANPIATAAAKAAVTIFAENFSYKKGRKIDNIFNLVYAKLRKELLALKRSDIVDVRYLGPIMVIEFDHLLNKKNIQEYFLKHNIWLRPFGKVFYLMPPYVITPEQLANLCKVVKEFFTKVYTSSSCDNLSDNFV